VFGVCDCKTHPFRYGRLHNGDIAEFSFVQRKLLCNLKKEEGFNLALVTANGHSARRTLWLCNCSGPVQ